METYFTVENVAVITSIVTGIFTLANVIVRATPSKKDDRKLAQIEEKGGKVWKILELITTSSNYKK